MKRSRFLHTLTFSAAVILAGCLTFWLSSCSEDRFNPFPETGEGEAVVRAEVVFSPVLDALAQSRSAGNALKHINSLCLVVYDKDDKFVRKITQDEMVGYQISNNDATAPDATPDGTHQAETQTPKATFTLNGFPYGSYRIYAVANMGDLSGYDGIFKPGESTSEALKDIPLQWNEEDISANDQMFGYLTTTDSQTSQGFDAPLLSINNTYVSLHAWVKRAASKVTVNVDGSGLNEGVQVWIKSVQIRDIPAYCYLGKNHAAASHLISEGEKIIISPETGEAGLSVTRTEPMLFSPDAAHSENADALYCYENLQGTGNSKKQDTMDADGNPGSDGKVDFPNGNHPDDKGFKDGKASGTYIEVVGYYRNNESKGPIIYRFMLGKDVDKDYNLERNYHYKLTLNLKNNANDADWHIVYDHDPEILVTEPFYISYLYDEGMVMPVKIMGAKIESLQANIKENGWHAINVPEGTKPFPYYTGTVNNSGPWDGFLSLRKTKLAVIGGVIGTNETYWKDNKRGTRTYVPAESEAVQKTDGKYSVTTNGGGEWVAKIPFYTRAKQLVPTTGYTGNNPYVAYQRKAVVTFTATVTDKNGGRHNLTKDVTVIQARRVVNPKGIWRSAGNDDEFHIVMKILPYETANEFEALKSDGPWYAVIERGDWFTLTPTAGVSQKNPDGSISGEDGTAIDFTYKPNGTATTPRFGIIKIYYNNFTCVHRIFVRQGYDPVEYPGTNVKWHSFNLYTSGAEASDPAEEGSYFKYNNWSTPVAASNNINIANGYPQDITPAVFHSNLDYDFTIAGGASSKKWQDIASGNATVAFSKPSVGGRVATRDEFMGITKNENTIYGYGVIYTDGSKETQTDVKAVYGYDRDNRANRGMRGTFVCDTVKNVNLFFPIGASGWGRIKRMGNGSPYIQANGAAGVVQYANRWEYYPSTGSAVVQDRPLFWDLYRRQGANYWMDKNAGENNGKAYNLDINYYTFDFNASNAGGLEVYNWGANSVSYNGTEYTAGSDALLVRLVDDK